MIDTEQYIDTIQDNKKTFVKTFVNNKQAEQLMYDYIETQRDFCKAVVSCSKIPSSFNLFSICNPK